MKRYVSSISMLGITIKTGHPVYENGQRVGDVLGKYAKFNGGVFETDDQETIDKLESLPTFGRDFFLEDETVEAKKEPKGDNLSALTVPQLKAKAQEAGIEVPQNSVKADIIKLLTSTPEGEGDKDEGEDAK